MPPTQSAPGGGSQAASLARWRHGPKACGCALCHQRQPHLGAKLQNASSWPTSQRLMTAYTGTSPLSQNDPNAYFTSTCCRAPFLPTSLSSRLPHPALFPAPHPSQLFSFFLLLPHPPYACHYTKSGIVSQSPQASLPFPNCSWNSTSPRRPVYTPFQ